MKNNLFSLFCFCVNSYKFEYLLKFFSKVNNRKFLMIHFDILVKIKLKEILFKTFKI